jgi:8-oxo-dGTP diphosphatase
MWALPGGFVELDEDLPDAAARELKEETGAEPRAMYQLGAWGTPGRDPRQRTVSAVYLVVQNPMAGAVKGADDAAEAAWHPWSDLPELAFDHEDIVASAQRRLRELVWTTHLAFAFLDSCFIVTDLQGVIEAVCGRGVTEERIARLVAAAELELAGDTGGEVRKYRCAVKDFSAPLEEPGYGPGMEPRGETI